MPRLAFVCPGAPRSPPARDDARHGHLGTEMRPETTHYGSKAAWRARACQRSGHAPSCRARLGKVRSGARARARPLRPPIQPRLSARFAPWREDGVEDVLGLCDSRLLLHRRQLLLRAGAREGGASRARASARARSPFFLVVFVRWPRRQRSMASAPARAPRRARPPHGHARARAHRPLARLVLLLVRGGGHQDGGVVLHQALHGRDHGAGEGPGAGAAARARCGAASGRRARRSVKSSVEKWATRIAKKTRFPQIRSANPKGGTRARCGTGPPKKRGARPAIQFFLF